MTETQRDRWRREGVCVFCGNPDDAALILRSPEGEFCCADSRACRLRMSEPVHVA